MYIQTQGVTTKGKRDTFRNDTKTRSWHWPISILILLVSMAYLQMDFRAPWLVMLITTATAILTTQLLFSSKRTAASSHTSRTLPTALSPTCPKATTTTTTTTKLYNKTVAGSNNSKRNYYWDFSDYAGLKFSYSIHGCQGYSFSYGDESSKVRTEIWNFVNWANYGNQGSTYELEFSKL